MSGPSSYSMRASVRSESRLARATCDAHPEDLVGLRGTEDGVPQGSNALPCRAADLTLLARQMAAAENHTFRGIAEQWKWHN